MKAAARGFLVVLALSIHDLFEGDSWLSWPWQLEIIFRHGPGSDQETDLSLVPAPRIRLAQVGHLRVSGSQVGQISGENNIKTF